MKTTARNYSPAVVFILYDRVYGKLKALTRKVAIWARLTFCNGQKLPLPQPAVMPSAANCLTQGA